jgi:DNA polymerase
MTSLRRLRAEAATCRACPLWRNATQTVFGEGPAPATMMLVGEQPGDVEDLAGRPFVGPAGRILDQALEASGIERGKAFVTNAVKHFKFQRRGKKRMHQRPTAGEMQACRRWLVQEIAAVRPRLIVALGASAARSLVGKSVTIGAVQNRLLETDAGLGKIPVLVTIHPSYVLRMPDAAARKAQFARLVADLSRARAAAASSRPTASR